MNYRHAYHAGNFADVLKHLVLSLVLVYLKRKEAPFRVIDTHAGSGLYDLSSAEAEKTGEWREGIGRLLAADIPDDLAGVFNPYLEAVRHFGGEGKALRSYPGSPLLAARFLRPDDRLIANELHPEDRQELERSLEAYAQAKTMGVDGYAALKATLPPKERRGLVLVDPPFEEPGEFDRLLRGLGEGLKRFRTGIYLLWYPIKDARAVVGFHRELAEFGLDKLVVVDFYVREAREGERLSGHGLAIVNAPYTLTADLERVLPFLVKLLAQGEGARFLIHDLSGSRSR